MINNKKNNLDLSKMTFHNFSFDLEGKGIFTNEYLEEILSRKINSVDRLFFGENENIIEIDEHNGFGNSFNNYKAFVSYGYLEFILSRIITNKEILEKRGEFFEYLIENKIFSNLLENYKNQELNFKNLFDVEKYDTDDNDFGFRALIQPYIETEYGKPDKGDESIRGTWQVKKNGEKIIGYYRKYNFLNVIFKLLNNDEIIDIIEKEKDSDKIRTNENEFIKTTLSSFYKFINSLDNLIILLKGDNNVILNNIGKDIEILQKKYKFDKEFFEILDEIRNDGNYIYEIGNNIGDLLQYLSKFGSLLLIGDFIKQNKLNKITHSGNYEEFKGLFSLKLEHEKNVLNNSTEDKDVVFSSRNGSGKTFFSQSDFIAHILSQNINFSSIEEGNFRIYEKYFFVNRMESGGYYQGDLSAWQIEGTKLNEIYQYVKNSMGNIYISLDEIGSTSDEESEFILLKNFIEAIKKLENDRIIRIRISTHNQKLITYLKENSDNFGFYMFKDYKLTPGEEDSGTIFTFQNLIENWNKTAKETYISQSYLDKLSEKGLGVFHKKAILAEKLLDNINTFLLGNPLLFSNLSGGTVKKELSFSEHEKEKFVNYSGYEKLFNKSLSFSDKGEIKTDVYNIFNIFIGSRYEQINGNIKAIIEKQKVIDIFENTDFLNILEKGINKLKEFFDIISLIIHYNISERIILPNNKIQKNYYTFRKTFPEEKGNVYDRIRNYLFASFHFENSYIEEIDKKILKIEQFEIDYEKELETIEAILSVFGFGFEDFLDDSEKEKYLNKSNLNKDELIEFFNKIRDIFINSLPNKLETKKLYFNDMILEGQKINYKKIDTDNKIIQHFFEFIDFLNSQEEKIKPFLKENFNILDNFASIFEGFEEQSLYITQMKNYYTNSFSNILGEDGKIKVQIIEDYYALDKIDEIIARIDNIDIGEWFYYLSDKNRYKNFGFSDFEELFSFFEEIYDNQNLDFNNLRKREENKKILNENKDKIKEYLTNFKNYNNNKTSFHFAVKRLGLVFEEINTKKVNDLRDLFEYIDLFFKEQKKGNLRKLGGNSTISSPFQKIEGLFQITLPGKSTSSYEGILKNFKNGINDIKEVISRIKKESKIQVEFTQKKELFIEDLQKQEGENDLVSNTISLDNENPILLVSGYNASGKTTLLDTINSTLREALNTGYVKAEKMRLGGVDNIVFIDRIITEKGLSAGENDINKWVEMLSEIRDTDLVILNADEIFSTMDLKYSTAFAYNFAGELLKKGVLSIIVSHNHNFIKLFSELQGVKTKKFDSYIDEKGEVEHTYKLVDGVVESSEGVNVLKTSIPGIEWLE